MSIIEDLIAFGLERRGQADPHLKDRRRWDSASVFNFITGLGGGRDKGAAGRPNPLILPLSWQEIEALWEHNGIARKIVETVPEHATRKGWDMPYIPEAELTRLRVQSNMQEGLLWGRAYGGAIGLMVTEDDIPLAFRGRPKDWLKQPMDLQRVGKFHALQIFDVYDCDPHDWDADIKGNNYRMPEFWSINADGISAVVHHSRVIHFRGNRRPPSWRRHGFRTYHNFPDVSILQAIWDDIRRYTEVMQGGATVAQELRQHVLKIGDYKGAMTGSQQEGVRAYIRQFVQNLSTLGLAFIGPDDEYHQAQTPPSGFMELSDSAKEALSAVTNIPQVILFGDTPSGLNTDGDSAWSGFRQMIDSHQQKRLKPGLERVGQTICAAQDGPTGGKVPDDMPVKFAALDEPSDAEEAMLRDQVANTDTINIQNGIYSAEHVARHRYGPNGWTSEPVQLEEADIQQMAVEQQEQQMLQLMAGGGMGQDPALAEDGEEEPPEEEPTNGAGPPMLPPAPGGPPPVGPGGSPVAGAPASAGPDPRRPPAV